MEREVKAQRYSAQRQVIYDVLKGTTAHPNVDEIYAEVKKTMPNVGIATVYRNLKQLVAMGLVNTLETTKDSIHYDADVSDHMHFICSECGAIKDLFMDSGVPDRVTQMGYEVKREKLLLYGICPDCKKLGTIKGKNARNSQKNNI